MPIFAGSSGSQKSLFCEYCGKNTLHESNMAQVGCVFTFLTCGLFLPIWILLQLIAPHYRCQTCGLARRAGPAAHPIRPAAHPVPPVAHPVPPAAFVNDIILTLKHLMDRLVISIVEFDAKKRHSTAPLNSDKPAKPLRSLSKLAVKSVLFALPGLFCFPLGIVGIVLGLQAYNQIKDKRNNERGEGVALTGIGLGIASLLLLVASIFAPRDNSLTRSVARDSSARSRAEADAWKEVDSSSEAVRESLRLIEAKLQEDFARGLTRGTGGVRVNVLDRVIPPMTSPEATRLDQQRYEVAGDFLWELTHPLYAQLTPPTSWSRDHFTGVIVQVERGKWEFETVKVGKSASYSTSEPVVPKVRSDSIPAATDATAVPAPREELKEAKAAPSPPMRSDSVPAATDATGLAPIAREITIVAVADAMVTTHTREGNPIDASSMNFGREREMTSGIHVSGYYDREVYIRFDLSAITGQVTSAKLRLNLAKRGNSISQYVALVPDDSWRESAITWNSKPRSGEVLASWSQRSGSIEADITEAVQSEVADNQLSLRIFTDSENGNATYHSREAIDETMRPQLIVTTISKLP